MKHKKFNVLLWNVNSNKIEHYDILPFFREEWKDRPYNWGINFEKEPITTKEQLEKWIKRLSQYQFCGRCEYEFLVGSWPFGKHKTTEKIIDFFSEEKDLNNLNENINFYNIITSEMVKIDAHEQIIMNIDIITDILFEEFFKKNN
jgi:hypothetical protein